MEMVSLLELEELSEGQLLDCAGDLAAMRNRCEVEILRVAVQHAYLNNAETLDPEESRRPGRERERRLGGPGTPKVTEFAAGTLGGRLGCSTVSAGMLMADGLDICHRLPQLWAQVTAGTVRVYLARLVARKTRDLSPEQTAYVDSRVAGYADGRLSYSRFEKLVEGAVAAADAEAARELEEKAARAQWARPTRPEEGESDHGLRGFSIRAPFPVIAVFDAAVQRIADILHFERAPRGRCRSSTCRRRPPCSRGRLRRWVVGSQARGGVGVTCRGLRRWRSRVGRTARGGRSGEHAAAARTHAPTAATVDTDPTRWMSLGGRSTGSGGRDMVGSKVLMEG